MSWILSYIQTSYSRWPELSALRHRAWQSQFPSELGPELVHCLSHLVLISVHHLRKQDLGKEFWGEEFSFLGVVYRVSTNFSCAASRLRIHGVFRAGANLNINESSALLLQRRWPRLKEVRGTCPGHTGWRRAEQGQRFQFILFMHMLILIFYKVSISTIHAL